MKKSFGLKNDFTWEQVRPDATREDYILVFDFENFCKFCNNTQNKYVEIVKNDLETKNS